MGLTKRQIRILMVSAGDHERLPKKDGDGKGSGITDKKDLKNVISKQQIPDKYKKLLRRGIKNPKKWAILGEKSIDDISIMNQPKVTGDMKKFLDLSRQSKSGIKMARNRTTPIKKKY